MLPCKLLLNRSVLMKCLWSFMKLSFNIWKDLLVYNFFIKMVLYLSVYFCGTLFSIPICLKFSKHWMLFILFYLIPYFFILYNRDPGQRREEKLLKLPKQLKLLEIPLGFLKKHRVCTIVFYTLLLFLFVFLSNHSKSYCVDNISFLDVLETILIY